MMQKNYVTIVAFSRLMTIMTKQKHDQQPVSVTHDRAESIGSVMCLLVSIIAIAAMIIQSIN